MCVPALVSEKFAFEKGIYSSKIQHILDLPHFPFKVALQISGRQFNKNTEKSSLYSQSLLIFIHKTPVVENHPTTIKIRDLLRPRSTPTGNTVYFYMSSSLSFTYWKYTHEASNIASDEVIMENNYISH